jgi:hypothetical protein
MKHYRILSATNEDTLAEYVEKAINDGWELIGDLKIDGSEHLGPTFYQPIIKIKRKVSSTGPE